VKDAAAGTNLLVFPGVEITCKDNAQCLAIFDPSAVEAVQSTLLAKLGGVLKAPPTDAKTVAIAPAGVNVEDLFISVASEPILRDVCILLPHFSDEEAHKSLNVAGYHPRFAGLPCDGVYIEKRFSDLDATTVKKIRGEIADWGSRRRALIATGDNRHEDFSRLGANPCWIKLGEYSAEAIRQALLADEARITYEPPIEPTESIRELRVKSSLVEGGLLTLTFNAGFTALIGGRGSGKTAILEYLRFGLGRTDSDVRGQEVARGRETRLIERTLQDGYVEVDVEREGIVETWHRDIGQREQIRITSDAGEQQVNLDEARRRFRARGFYQKELSTTTSDATTAADQITGIAAAEALDKRRAVDQEIKNAQRTVSVNLQQVAAHWQMRLEHKQAGERVADLKRRLESITEQLNAQGMSPEHLALIEKAPRHTRAKAYLDEVRRTLDSFAKQIQTVTNSLNPVDIGGFDGAGDFPELVALHDALVARHKALTEHLNAALAELRQMDGDLQKQSSAYAQTLDAFQMQYAAAVEQETAHRAIVAEAQRLAAELRDAEAEEGKTAAKVLAGQNSITQFAAARDDLDRLLEARFEILKDAAEQVAGKSSNLLKARPYRDGKPAEYVDALCRIMEGSRIHDLDQKCTEWVQALVSNDGEWRRISEGFVSLFEAKIDAGSNVDPGDQVVADIQRLIFGGGGASITDNQARGIYRNLNDKTVSAVIAATPRDLIMMSYVDERGQTYQFDIASPGQQASALLELLLRQQAGTLIIDQPEDDLDNRVVMKIAELIRTSKSTRQLVFTTHNANLVVNGDADKIIALKSAEPPKNGQPSAERIAIEQDGAIETPQMRDVITEIMEGGEEAFDLRGRKYRFTA
jgi:ABC-type lipoprotein export system ATPase subunit